MWRERILLATAVALLAGGSLQATEWVADFTSTPPESFAGSDNSAVANYTDTLGGNPNFYAVTFPLGGSIPAGWLTQGSRAGIPTTARFFNAPDSQGARARFSTVLPATMDANAGVAFAWTARYGSYAMGRAPIQLCVTDTGLPEQVGTTEFNAYLLVQNGTTLAIQSNGGGLFGTIDPLVIPNVADGQYHQWSCAVITSGGLAHWKLWLDGLLLIFSGVDGAHLFDPGGGAQQFSFQTGSNGFAGNPYVGLGDLNTGQDEWNFEFDCVAYRDDGLADNYTCGETLVQCDSLVSPSGPQSTAALRNQPADPPLFSYTFTNASSGATSYTVAETDADGNPQAHPWLSLSKNGNLSVPPGGNDTVDATITDTSLAGGTYTGYVTFTDGCNPANRHIRQITLTITDCAFTVSPVGEIARSVTAGSVPVTPDAVFAVTNTGTPGLTYSAQEDSDCPWLTLSLSGGGPLDNGETEQVTASINAAGLGTGVHTCTLRFSTTTGNCSNQPADLLRTVVLHVLDVTSGLEQFNAEFTTFSGSDLTAISPLESCDPNVATTREFHVQGIDTSLVPPGWLTQGSIEGLPTTARFFDPPGEATRGRDRFRVFLPFDNTYAPARGMAVAWRMRVGNYAPVRGPIQITFPRVPGPFGTNPDTLTIPGEVFNAYIRIQNGTNVNILRNGGAGFPDISTLILPASIADEYHQWTAAACYNGADQMAYWNLWLDGNKLLFTGANGTVSGPGGGTFSFRTFLEDVTGDPYIGLGELQTSPANGWDFEFDWVRLLSYNIDGCPFWDGEGCAPVPACPIPFADADEDDDVDSDDFAALQRCINIGLGSPPATLPEECLCFDRNRDKVIGTFDLAKFEACNTGPDVLWQSTPGCP